MTPEEEKINDAANQLMFQAFLEEYTDVLLKGPKLPDNLNLNQFFKTYDLD